MGVVWPRHAWPGEEEFREGGHSPVGVLFVSEQKWRDSQMRKMNKSNESEGPEQEEPSRIPGPRGLGAVAGQVPVGHGGQG